MDKKKDLVIEELKDIVELMHDGGELAIVKGLAGADIELETQCLILELIEQYLREES